MPSFCASQFSRPPGPFPNRGKVGLARVVSAPYPDAKDPKLVVVDVEAVKPLPRTVPLTEIKSEPAFADLGLVRVPRLSVVPVEPAQWKRMLGMAGA